MRSKASAALRPITFLRNLFPAGRLVLAATAGVVSFALLPETLRASMRLAAGWVAAVVLFLALTALVMAGASPDRVRRRARLLDPRRWVILAIVVVAAGISLVALILSVHKDPQETAQELALRLLLTGLTVVASWMLTHTVFALHYAHHYYGDGPAPGEDDRGGLAFPGGAAPAYWDFLYFSFVIGMTCQVSDVQVTSPAMRRLTLIHGVLAFFFNTVILALAVNLLAGTL